MTGPSAPPPDGRVLRQLQALLLALSLGAAGAGLLLSQTGGCLITLGFSLLFLAGALSWAGLATALARATMAPVQTWSEWEQLAAVLAFLGGTAGSIAMLRVGLGRIALAAAGILLVEAGIVLVKKRWSLSALVLFFLLALCLAGIPLFLAVRAPAALNAAIQMRDLLTERLLLAGGALRFDDGGSALGVALHEGDRRSFELLLRHGVNPNQRFDGGTILGNAAAQQPAATVRVLLAHGADPNLLDQWDQTALIRALNAGRLDNASLLLAHGADPNARGKRQRTALMLAAQDDRLDLVRFLLAHGADPNLRDANGATALSLAGPKSAELLRAAKVDLAPRAGRKPRES